MTGFTPFVAGNVLTAANLNALLPTYIIKLATETVTNSATLQNDDELFLTLSPNRIYQVELNLIFGCTVNTADIQMAWTISGTITHVGSRTCYGPSINTTDQGGTAAAATTVGVVRMSGGHGIGTAVSYGSNGTQNTSAVQERIVLNAGASGGTLQLQWAQNTAAAATSTSVVSGSYVIATPIS